MNSFELNRQLQDFIDEYLTVSNLSTATSVKQQRLDYARLVEHFRHPRPAGIESREQSADGRHGPIAMRRYRYRQGNDQALILFIHGGGFILGDLDTHDDICAELCARSGYDLVAVDYRLAPEHLHPVHLDDVEDAFKSCDHAKTILVGASAGGTLAAALSFRLARAARRPAAQVLVYPTLGGECYELESYRRNAQAPLLSTEDILFYRAARCAENELPLQDPEFYPLVADDFGGLPPTVAISADVDPLRDDACLYVERLKAAGVAAQWINETGLVHDYLRARHHSDRAGAAFARICAAITRLAEASSRP